MASSAAEEQKMFKELDYNIQHFNEMFIENLSQSLSAILVKKPPADAEAPVLPAVAEEAQSEDEPEEEAEVDEREVLESSEEARQEDEAIRQQLKQQEQQIFSLEGDLKSKESLLHEIKEQHKKLSSNLLEAMRNEYHKKIANFQSEMLALEQERQEQIRKADNVQQKTRLEEVYKKKLKELEDKVNLAKNKEKEQQMMMKQSSSQKLKIKALEGEIEKMKTQKVSLMKKIKEESELHRKWKADRVKELLQVKSANLRKDREIQQLRRDNLKKDQIARRKQEELVAMQKKSKSDK